MANMLTIGIELNHVVRNVNKQILKYYQRDVDQSLDIDEVDDKCDVFKEYVKFNSKSDKYNFLYIDYPYEIFGCANAMEKELPSKITKWLSDVTDIEEEEIRIIFYSLDEDALTIQSTYFFLSKIGARVRKMLFPKSIEEVWDECDVVITARDEFFEKEKPSGKKIVLIDREFNSECKGKADLSYGSLGSVIDDDKFFSKILDK